jgi:Zn-dependent protease
VPCRTCVVGLKCQICAIEVEMPFICSFCGGAFCPEHRLPEGHNCPEYWMVRTRRQPVTGVIAPPDIRTYARPRLRGPSSKIRFSTTEITHIVIGIILVSGVGLSFFTPRGFSDWLAVAAAVLFFTTGFIIHELTHKAMAQRYGMWAEFRLNTFGAVLTAISVISPFKIIAPGAVVIAGNTTLGRVGRTAAAGPVTNILIASLLFGLAQIFHPPRILDAMIVGAAINAFMAVFNLIPFGVFDGLKVFRWSKSVWLALFAVAAFATLLSYTAL